MTGAYIQQVLLCPVCIYSKYYYVRCVYTASIIMTSTYIQQVLLCPRIMSAHYVRVILILAININPDKQQYVQQVLLCAISIITIEYIIIITKVTIVM